ncbi:hypothetical protein, partial [Enterococcus faecium]|uniref:hypothetical protein n=1 Tax=Enterococcus faecium TaxID=1352 RepID=UPI003F423F4C
SSRKALRLQQKNKSPGLAGAQRIFAVITLTRLLREEKQGNWPQPSFDLESTTRLKRRTGNVELPTVKSQQQRSTISR